MLSTANTVVVVPSPQQQSPVIHTTQNSFDPVTVNGWHHQEPTTTSHASTASERIKSFLDFRAVRTGSNEAVVGDNNGSGPIKAAPYRVSTSTTTPISAINATKPRSLSAGRTRTSCSGADLVQDIYDRLGISRGDLASSKGKTVQQEPDIRKNFLNYKYGTMKGTATSPDSNGPTVRGRSLIQNSTDVNDDGQLRSRSLSRGRQFRSIWPPASENQSNIVAPVPSGPMPNSPKYRRTDEALDPILSPNQQRSNALICSPEQAAAVMLSPSRQSLHRNSQVPIVQKEDELLPGTKGSPSRVTINYKVIGGSIEEKTTSTDVSLSNDGETVPSGLSVKERMRAFSDPIKKTTTDIKKTKTLATPARNYPPLIDIYADDRMRYQNDSTLSVEGDEEKKDDEVEYTKPALRPLRQRQSTSSVDSTNEITTSSPSASRGKGTLLASTFLAAIQTSPTSNFSNANSPRHIAPTFSFAPINEIATDDLLGSALDTGSVSILSSVGSHDEQQQNNATYLSGANRGNNNNNNGASTAAVVRKPSWLDNRTKQQQRGSVNNTNTKVGTIATLSTGQYQYLPPSSTTTATTSSGHNYNNESSKNQQQHSASTSMIIERMVEERVQARVAELERHMEQQMRAYMQEMEAKMASRIASYEKEITNNSSNV